MDTVVLHSHGTEPRKRHESKIFKNISVVSFRFAFYFPLPGCSAVKHTGAGDLGFNYRADQIRHSYPLPSPISVSQKLTVFHITIKFLMSLSLFSTVIEKSRIFDVIIIPSKI